MPYKSSKQQAYFHQMLKENLIDKKVVQEFDKASKGKKLPKKVEKKEKK